MSNFTLNVGLLVAGLSLTPGCGPKSQPVPADPPPEVIEPRAMLLRMPYTRGFISFEVSVAVSPNGRTVAAGRLDVPPGESASSGTVVSLCDTAGLRERAAIRGEFGDGSGVAFSPDGGTLAVGMGRGVVLYDPETCKERATFTSGVAEGAPCLAYSADGRRLAAASGDGYAVVWDVRTGREVALMKAHSRSLQGVALSPDGLSVASASDGPIVCSPVGGFLGFGRGWACWPDHGVVRLFDVETGRETASLEHEWTAHSVAFSPDGRTLASGGGGAAKLWGLATGQARTLTEAGVDLDVYSVTFSPDGRTLAIAVGSRDFQGDYGEVRLWDVGAGRVRAVMKADAGKIRSLAFAPDGRSLVAGSRRAVVVWDVPPVGERIGVAEEARAVPRWQDGRTPAIGKSVEPAALPDGK